MKIEEMSTEQKNERVALRLAKILIKNNLHDNTRIYFNGKCLINGDIDSIKEGELGSMYTEFANDATLTCTFDCTPLYKLMNHSIFPFSKIRIKPLTEMKKLFNQYGMHYEIGDWWNFSLYPNEQEKDKRLYIDNERKR